MKSSLKAATITLGGVIAAAAVILPSFVHAIDPEPVDPDEFAYFTCSCACQTPDYTFNITYSALAREQASLMCDAYNNTFQICKNSMLVPKTDAVFNCRLQ